ncbi:MAG: PIG-L family deacetylase [Flavobacteriales bacterium]|nr:PIG-L family deacetylase [Flavobacteriales bacterium]
MHLLPGRALAFASLLSAFLLPLSSFPQRPPEQPNAAEILHRMQKLNVLGSVLYIAAHPDDENTRLIAWLSNGKKVRTGYLSLTRGDGGQNLIGPELGDALGIIRTQELLEARRIDGGEQFFTRAVDFGFSKNAAESFEKWGKQEVLSDVVRVIRMFRPDVIITRFPPTREAGHGHHEASAILAAEAFELAGDPKAFPEQLEQGLEVWQPRRLFFNGSTWWKKDLAEFAKTDPDWFTVDVGGYDPLLGLSYTEIAGRSRSMHKSQGFGAAETRGEQLEFLKLVKGDRPKSDDIFEGIDMTWGRVIGGRYVESVLNDMTEKYQPNEPWLLLPALDDIEEAMRELMVQERHRSMYSLINSRRNIALDMRRGVTGQTVELLSERPFFSISDSLSLNVTAITRGEVLLTSSLVVQSWPWIGTVADSVRTRSFDEPIELQPQAIVEEPYWLKARFGNLYLPHDEGVVPVQTSNTTLTHFTQSNSGLQLWSTNQALYKWVDRVAGERIRPVYVTPVASVIPRTDVQIARGGPQSITVEVEALTDSLHGQLNVTLPDGWAAAKDLKLVNITKRNERQSFTYQLIPGDNAKAGAVRFTFSGPKGKADRTLHEIDYPHIMPQVYYTPAEVKLVPLDVKSTARTVGYIKGAGDEVPEAIEQLGVKVDIIDPAMATLASLKPYDAIVTGIRAYNTTKALKDLNRVLMQYVEEGGTLVCQYNTRSSDMVLPDTLFGPYPFKLTRDRVTVEEAPPTFLAKDHPLLNTPNKLTTADFDGWVQERGLYFCGSLDPHYTPIIAWNDPGEQPLNGGLITCDYGKGRYVYTGISFFRQLPAGVPGAYRLFANLIAPRTQQAK